MRNSLNYASTTKCLLRSIKALVLEKFFFFSEKKSIVSLNIYFLKSGRNDVVTLDKVNFRSDIRQNFF